jgi:uncharacterized protein YjbI with pentapeptide repeats
MSDDRPSPSHTQLDRPTTDDGDAWRLYWQAQGQPWRTEPEIEAERRAYLDERRAVQADVERGVYAFQGVALTRADVEWLLATHEYGHGPVDWSVERQRGREGLDLRGADLREEDLSYLPLARVRLGLDTVHLSHVLIRHSLHALARDADTQDDSPERLPELARAAAHLERADLSFAHLEHADLSFAHLEAVDLREAHLDGAELDGAHLEGANLRECALPGAILEGAHLEGASLEKADLRRARFDKARLEGADLSFARAEGASFAHAQLQGAHLVAVHLQEASLADACLAVGYLADGDLERVRAWQATFPEALPPADLRLAFFDAGTMLQGVVLGDEAGGSVSLADVRWGGVNLAVVDWEPVVELGDEREAWSATTPNGKGKAEPWRRGEFEVAVRANRQLATALRDQGLNEHADTFAYRAQKLQREVLRRQARWPETPKQAQRWQRAQKYGAYGFSLFLDGLAGYGYKPGRSLVAYLATLVVFSVAYFTLGQTTGPHLTVIGAVALSVNSFHGRGFVPGSVTADDPAAVLAAVEAVVGLIIEISFIATFTQRFFAR